MFLSQIMIWTSPPNRLCSDSSGFTGRCACYYTIEGVHHTGYAPVLLPYQDNVLTIELMVLLAAGYAPALIQIYGLSCYYYIMRGEALYR